MRIEEESCQLVWIYKYRVTKDIVQRLMQAERIPVSKMEQRKAK